MTEAAPSPASPPAPAVYEIGGGRKTIFSLLFMLLLPFFASLPFMMAMRIKHGLYQDTAGLAIMGLAFAAVMFLIFSQLMYSLRSRVVLGKDAVRFTLPAGGGPTPMLRYASHTIPYSDIAGVETRREIYGSALAPVTMRGARILLKDGKAVRLGYTNEADPDPALPYVQIGERIAERAGVPVTDRGNLRRTVHKKMLGLAASAEENAQVSGAELQRLNVLHRRWVAGLVGTLALLVAAGMLLDIARDDRWHASAQASAPAKAPAKATK